MGVRLPLLPLPLEAWPSLARQRVASAQAARAARRFESCCLRHRPVAQRRRAVGFGPTRARSNRAGVSMCTMRRRSTAGRPVVTRRMLVRPQPSQPHSCPGRLTVEDAGLSHRKRGFDSRSGYFTLSDASGICGPVVSRVRRVRFPSRALLAVAQWMSSALLPRAMGVRLLPARLRRKASSEPAGRESVEQGAIPWRRPM